ncbi:MAG TPA: hypothetical protein VFO29_09135 [Candidatus Rubrimentiphilum sp.]|nr:hypothetical protein [Candidatus Rubrimentiphilum sp.]
MSGAQPACRIDRSYDIALPGHPQGISVTADGTLFVALNATKPSEENGIAVLACHARHYELKRVFQLEHQPNVLALTHDGKMLVVPDDNFIAFIDTRKLRSGTGQPLLGFIEDIPGDDGGAVYATVSPDDRQALVAEEGAGTITVIDLQRVRAGKFDRAVIGADILVGSAPVTLAYAKDGKYVFATVQRALPGKNWEATCNPQSGSATDPKERPGAVVTLDASRLVTDKDGAIVSYVPAGCHPVRAALSPDDSRLWVSARASNKVFSFSTDDLRGNAANPQSVQVLVGPAPVPIIVTASGKHVLVGNSNRFNAAPSSQTPIDVIDAKTGQVAMHLRSGEFPRQFAISPDGSTIFVSNYGSDSISLLDARSL